MKLERSTKHLGRMIRIRKALMDIKAFFMMVAVVMLALVGHYVKDLAKSLREIREELRKQSP